MQLDNDQQFVSSMIEDREKDINAIAASIEEINGIFVDLAQLVNEQAPMVGKYRYLSWFWCTNFVNTITKLDNIEANISSADRNVGKGVGELRQAAGYLDSARTKMCCIIVTILIIVGIVVGVLVLGTVASSLHCVD